MNVSDNVRELTPDMNARQGKLYEALEEITDELGAFDQSIGGNGAHYVDGANNPFAAEGMQCANCAFYQGPRACEVVEGEINPAGICKLWIIPERLLTMDQAETAAPAARSEDTKNLRRYQPVQFERAADDKEGRTFTFPFSSEFGVARYFGNEVLSHENDAADLARLNDGAPLLWNHDPGKVVGVVERAWVDEQSKRGYSTVRFSRNAFAQEVLADVKDGVLRNVSFAYEINDMQQRGEDFVATKWTPYEVSVVSIPADPTVGVGRAFDAQPAATAAITPQPEPEVQMDNTPDLAVVRAEAAEAERSRISGITSLCEKHGMSELAGELVRGGKGIDEARSAVLERMGSKQQPVNEKAADLGLTRQEVERFSFVRAINALAHPTDRRAQENARFEFEVSEAAAKAMGKDSRGITVPAEVLRRDLTVGTASAGGNTVATDLLAANFIDLLRNKAVVMGLGTQMLTGLQGNIAIPRQTGGATGYWVAESGAPTESQQAFDQVTMSPKTLGAFTDISRKLLLQSSVDIETFVRNDLATVLAIEIDRAAIHGSGSSNQPTGILATSGIGSVVGGTNGAAPTYANIVSLETEVAQDNADIGSLSYLTNTKVRGKLKGTYTNSTYGEIPVFGQDGRMNGYNAAITNQVSSTLTKGSSSVCSAIIFGNFADLIVGMWGSLDLMVDPYTASTSGTVRVVALQDLDIAVRHPESFAAMLDALTA
jgi:HK97 family phage major capsid protein/HK97 family phage prohead protease